MDVTILVKAAAGDMLKAEKGSQWPLSCYGPFPAKPCFPGFEDKSFEEVRLGFYEGQQNGTLDQYKQQLTQLLQETQLKIKALLNPSPDAINMLKNLYYNTQNTFSNANSSIFGNKPTNYANNIYGAPGQSNPQTNYTFAPPENKNLFANTQPTFQLSNSVFASGNNQNFSNTPINKSIFGATAPSQSVFGGTAANQSIFGSNTANQSLFGGAPPTQNAFGNATNQNIFTAAAVNQSLFNNPAVNPNVFTSTANPSIFTSSAPNQGVFTSSAPNQSIFTSSVPNQNTFSTAAPNQSVFTNAPPNQNVFTSSAQNQNIFTNTASGQNIFTSAAPNQNIYTSTASTPNIFTSAAPSQNLFAGATTNTSNTFGGSQPPQIFGNQAVLQNLLTQTSVAPVSHTQSIFGSVTASNQPNFGSVSTNQNCPPYSSPLAVPLNTTSSASNIFQQANSNFNQTPAQSLGFGSPSAGPTHTASIFGNRSMTANRSVKKEDDPTIYSKLSDLTSNDIIQFEHKCFEFGKIPIRAPPLEMC